MPASTAHLPIIEAIETDEMSQARYQHLAECAECRALARAGAHRIIVNQTINCLSDSAETAAVVNDNLRRAIVELGR